MLPYTLILAFVSSKFEKKILSIDAPQIFLREYSLLLYEKNKIDVTNNGFEDSRGTRVNKCIPSLSRRQADDAVRDGRITINNSIAALSSKVYPGDVVKLDGKLQRWEESAATRKTLTYDDLLSSDSNLVYLKYWKPVGVTCTTDKTDKSNIINAGNFDLFPQRLFPVGRLDKESSGLIILTSDGNIVNQLLASKNLKEKKYIVELNKEPTEEDIHKLAEGVIITTSMQRDSGKKFLTARTLPCKISRIKGKMRYVKE